MPTDIIHLPSHYKSRGQLRHEAIGEGLRGAAGLEQQYIQQRQQQSEKEKAEMLRRGVNQQLSQAIGQEVPYGMEEMVAEKLFQNKMQLEREREIELLKQQGKKQLLGDKLSSLQGIMSGGVSTPNRDQMMEDSGGIEALPQKFDASSISDQDIAKASLVDPNFARSLQHAKDVALREKREKEHFEFEKEKASPEYRREQQLEASQAQADIKYNVELQSAHKQHEIKKKTLEDLSRLNKKGVTGKPWEKLAEKFGLVNLTSEGRREFAADVKNLITDIRSILGSQFSQFEFQTILNAYPSADFSQKANEAILKNLMDFEDIRDKEFEIANQIKKENKGKIPFDYQSQVNKRLQEYAQSKIPQIKENSRKIMNEEYGISEGHTLMFDPNGEALSVPESDVAKYLELGASLP